VAPGAEPDAFDGDCAICGAHGRFVKDDLPTRESYRCPLCHRSLRYQAQARILVDRFSRHGATCFADLAREPEFGALRIFEPGDKGPFPRYLSEHPQYLRSGYWPDAAPGEVRDGVRCEDLMAMTYPASSFDLVLTADIFEHVRKPELGFREIHRVLAPGGVHVFSIPVTAPMQPTTAARVNTSGPDDVFLTDPAYHNGHLVYNDFGEDILTMLDGAGFDTEIVPFESASANASRLLTFCSVKPAGSDTPATRKRSWRRR